MHNSEDDIDGSGFAGDGHDFLNFFARGARIGADIEFEGRACFEALFEVSGEFLGADGATAAEELAFVVDINDIAVTLVGGDFTRGSFRNFDIKELFAFGDFAREHEEKQEQKGQVDHWGDLEPDLLVFDSALAAACHGVVLGLRVGIVCRCGCAVGLASEEVEHMGEGFVEICHVAGQEPSEEEIEEHRGNRQQETTGGGDEGLTDALGEVCGFGFTSGECAKTCDHACGGSEKADHWSEDGKCVHIIDDDHHFCLVAEALVTDVVFHCAFVIHVALEVCFRERAGEDIGHHARRGVTEAVGALEVALGHKSIELCHQWGRHEFLFAKHQGAIAADRGHSHGAEGNDVHDGAALLVEIHEALVGRNSHGVGGVGNGEEAEDKSQHQPVVTTMGEAGAMGSWQFIYFHFFYFF